MEWRSVIVLEELKLLLHCVLYSGRSVGCHSSQHNNIQYGGIGGRSLAGTSVIIVHYNSIHCSLHGIAIP